MSFDPKSLERLRKLGRNLPQPLPISKKEKTIQTNKLHPVETEEDPKALFHELINISPDGTVPPHLMNRLKELEKRKESLKYSPTSAAADNQKETNSAPLSDFNKNTQKDLYEAFNQLLLESEEEIYS